MLCWLRLLISHSVVAKHSQGAQMPAEQHHVDLNRIIDRAEMRLEQYALHVQGLANDGRQTLIAQAELQQELDALIRLQAYRRKSI